MNWVECGYCETEFRVVSDSMDSVAYCPYCGEDIQQEEDEYEEDDEDEEEKENEQDETKKFGQE